MVNLTPALKWAGGKRWIIPRLNALLDGVEYDRFVEPFVGGLSVSLGLNPRKATLNDINPHLINFYRQLKKGFVTRARFENDEDYYYRRRDEFNQAITCGDHKTQRCAELFYYLNRTGFNGLCRFNSGGLFNVPFGRYGSINYLKDFTGYRSFFRGHRITNKDFDQLSLNEGDLVYSDSPYDTDFTRYSQQDFNWDDQVRLATWLSEHKGPVVAQNQATPRIMKLYREHGFTVSVIKAPRRISCNGDRSHAKEMLARKNL